MSCVPPCAAVILAICARVQSARISYCIAYISYISNRFASCSAFSEAKHSQLISHSLFLQNKSGLLRRACANFTYLSLQDQPLFACIFPLRQFRCHLCRFFLLAFVYLAPDLLIHLLRCLAFHPNFLATRGCAQRFSKTPFESHLLSPPVA